MKKGLGNDSPALEPMKYATLTDIVLARRAYARRGMNMQIAAKTSKGKNARIIRTIAPPINGPVEPQRSLGG